MLSNLKISGVDKQLKQAVLSSLICKKARNKNDILSGEAGWWADYLDVEGDAIGSYLWTLERSVLSEETLEETKNFVLESLDWLKQEGKLTSVEVVATAHQGLLNLEVTCN